jgi:hypothetical protein
MDKFGFVHAACFINCNGIQVLKKFGLNKLDVSLLESKLPLNLHLQIERERKIISAILCLNF